MKTFVFMYVYVYIHTYIHLRLLQIHTHIYMHMYLYRQDINQKNRKFESIVMLLKMFMTSIVKNLHFNEIPKNFLL